MMISYDICYLKKIQKHINYSTLTIVYLIILINIISGLVPLYNINIYFLISLSVYVYFKQYNVLKYL